MLFGLLITLSNSSLLHAGFLHDAIATNDLQKVKAVVENNKNIDLDETDDEGSTPLYTAAQMDNFEILEYIMNQGADPNKTDSNGWTPLHVLVLRATQCGLFFNKYNDNFFNPIKYLIEHGSSINLITKRGRSIFSLCKIPVITDYINNVKNYFDSCVMVTEKTGNAHGQLIDPKTIPNYELLNAVIKKKSSLQNNVYKKHRISNLNNTHFLFIKNSNIKRKFEEI